MDGASRSSLVGALLVHEKETLAGLGSPSGKVVVLDEGRDFLHIDRVGAEEEELLGVEKVPKRRESAISPVWRSSRARRRLTGVSVLRKVAALVLQLASLNRHDLLRSLGDSVGGGRGLGGGLGGCKYGEFG